MAAETVTIRDSASGAEASILPSLGFNCFQFQAMHEGSPVELLWSEEGFEQGDTRPSGSGIPLLFPFPGRIQGVDFHWEGRTYSLQAGDGRGNAIHGFAHTRPWRVIEQSANRVVGRFQASMDDPTLADQWPADFRLTASYEVAGNALRLHLLVENPGETPLPCGLGAHPYFRVPIGGASANDCVVKFPVTTQWELDGMLTTGQQIPLPEGVDYNAGISFKEMSFDTVFGGLQSNDGTGSASVKDPHSGLTMLMEFCDVFRECVVYNPPHREAVCIEPYTCPPDPFRLHKQGIDAGLRILAPGESFAADISLRLLAD